MNKQWIEARKEAILKAVNKDPEVPTRTLARKLHDECGDLFPSIDSARSCVRLYRGERGTEKRGSKILSSKKRQVNTPIGNIVPVSDNPPETTEPYDLKLKGYGTIFSDIHVPYHSEEALSLALEHTDKVKAFDWLILNGDIIDFYLASRFSKNPKVRDIVGEIDMVCRLLADLKKYFKRIIFKMGNHEKRLQDYLYINAPEIANLKCLSFPDLFRAHDLGIEIVMPQQIMKAGKYLTILHGHEFGRSFFSPVNAARGAYLRAKNNAITAHLHQVSEHTESDIRDNIVSTWSLGCLSHLNPPYAPINNWSHGFINMEMIRNDFEVENHRIINGKVR